MRRALIGYAGSSPRSILLIDVWFTSAILASLLWLKPALLLTVTSFIIPLRSNLAFDSYEAMRVLSVLALLR